MDLVIVTLKTVFFYFFIILAYRIMGKREVGQLGVIDLIVSILIAEMVAISIENYEQTLLKTVIPIGVLVILEIVLAYLSTKSRKIRNFLGGKPSLIICDGKLNYSEMAKLRYSLDDLLVQLRQNGNKSIEEIEYALLESNGKLSIFPYDLLKLKSSYPLPLIIDGKIDYNTLTEIKKSKAWLINELLKSRLTSKDVLYAFYKRNKIYLIRRSEVRK